MCASCFRYLLPLARCEYSKLSPNRFLHFIDFSIVDIKLTVIDKSILITDFGRPHIHPRIFLPLLSSNVGCRSYEVRILVNFEIFEFSLFLTLDSENVCRTILFILGSNEHIR